MTYWPTLPSVFIVFIAVFCLSQDPANAEEKPSEKPSEKPPSKAEKLAEGLNKETLALKQEIIELNRELYQFEEDLLYPVNTQIAIFLGLAPDTGFILDSIEVQLDDTLVSSYLYQEKEINALKRGGIQKLYVGSLSDGKHKLSASFNGQGTSSRYFKRKKSMTFSKKQKAKYIQLVVSEDKRTGEPLFKVKQW